MFRRLSLFIIAFSSLSFLWTPKVMAAQQGRILKAYYNPIAQKLFEQKESSSQWKGYFSAKSFGSSPQAQQKINNIQELLRKTMANLSSHYTKELHHLEIRQGAPEKPRGLAGSHRMILNVDHIGSNEELSNVFIHEMGHIIDLGALKGSSSIRSGFVDRKKFVPADDPSSDFYRISWINNTLKRKGATRQDFVSGYATTNPFEDFAETFTFYRNHGDKFRALNEKSESLKKKYKFMQNTVFFGEEFQRGMDYTYQNDAWDTTLIPTS